MELIKGGHLPYLKSGLLRDLSTLTHAFSTRQGGVSSGELHSLNLAFHAGDDSENVLENRRRFFKCFSQDEQEVVAAIQVHGTGIAAVDAQNRGQGAAPATAVLSVDALVTTTPNLALLAFAADCLLIYFAAKSFPLVAIAHAGREGTYGGMAKKMMQYITKNYPVRAGDIAAAFSPSICKNCYTVDEAQAERFKAAGWGDRKYLEPVKGGRWKLDLAAINAAQLFSEGLDKKLLQQTSYCTCCEEKLFYSYRRDQGQTGRMIGFIKTSQQGENRLE